jgi:hypothetical protein
MRCPTRPDHGMATDLYVYYRVRVERATQLQAQVATMQATLQREYGVSTQLKQRPDAKDGRHTWMEVYSAIPEGFEILLEQAADRSGIKALIEGDRHVERFIDPPAA